MGLVSPFNYTYTVTFESGINGQGFCLSLSIDFIITFEVEIYEQVFAFELYIEFTFTFESGIHEQGFGVSLFIDIAIVSLSSFSPTNQIFIFVKKISND